MDFMNRGAQPAHATASSSGQSSSTAKKNWNSNPMWMRVVLVVLLFAGTILVVSLLALLYFGGPKESNYVDKSKVQAVFLANGQVYFGKIAAVNKQFIDLQGIYYLNVNQQVQPDQKDNKSSNSSVSLVKLGCELHGPVDQMIINRDQVTFWENLKTDGQVTKAISQWMQQNPNGQQCASSTSNSTTSKP